MYEPLSWLIEHLNANKHHWRWEWDEIDDYQAVVFYDDEEPARQIKVDNSPVSRPNTWLYVGQGDAFLVGISIGFISGQYRRRGYGDFMGKHMDKKQFIEGIDYVYLGYL